MKAYKQVPTWWFLDILVVNITLIFFACIHYKVALQFPWWGVLLVCAIAVVFTLPIGVISATLDQSPGLNIITEYIIGYVYPERPFANMAFKVYEYISMAQALTFLSDFKLGHYMKISPRAMFTALVACTLVSVIVYQVAALWLMGTIHNLCNTSLLSPNIEWTYSMDTVFYAPSLIWGLVGPQRIFGNLSLYSNVNWFILGGVIAPKIPICAY